MIYEVLQPKNAASREQIYRASLNDFGHEFDFACEQQEDAADVISLLINELIVFQDDGVDVGGEPHKERVFDISVEVLEKTECLIFDKQRPADSFL